MTLPLPSSVQPLAEALVERALGALSGAPLRVTPEHLKRLCPHARESLLGPLAEAMGQRFPEAEITTPIRLCHFLAQAAEETDGLRTLVEYASGAAYEGRHDLGNVHRGDGRRYKGRGIFQLTGRANYRAFGRLVQVPLEQQPEMAALPHVAVHVACLFWARRNLNQLADADDLRKVTRRVNGGQRGLPERARLLRAAKAIWMATPG